MDFLLLTASSGSPTVAANSTGETSWTDTWGFVVGAAGFVLSLIVAIVGWFQIRGAKADAAAAKTRAEAAHSLAESAEQMVKVQTEPRLEVRTGMVDLDPGKITSRSETHWRVYNYGNAPALSAYAYLNFDENGLRFGQLSLGDIPGNGAYRVISSPRGPLPEFSEAIQQSPGNVIMPLVTVEYKTVLGEKRAVECRPHYQSGMSVED